MRILPALVLLAIVTAPAPGLFAGEATLAGRACVIDGDSLMIGGKRNRKGFCDGGVDSRLNGVDAPEWDETCRRSGGGSWPCGQEAKAAMKALADGREVNCQIIDRDWRTKRPVVVCLAGGRDIGRELVRLGLAAACERYSERYVNQEAEAKAARRGIWAGDYVKPGYCEKKKR